MKERILDLKADFFAPNISLEALFEKQKISSLTKISKMSEDATSALDLFYSKCEIKVLVTELDQLEFQNIFIGENKNEEDAPLPNIFCRASKLALFSLTLGQDLGREITSLFSRNQGSVAYFFNYIASWACDLLVIHLEDVYIKLWNLDAKECAVLGYSPGYCGWELSGQKKLFEYLRPEKIGISLNQRYLMSPTKSVTGILLGGKKEIHLFKNSFNFCTLCKNKTCRSRLRSKGIL